MQMPKPPKPPQSPSMGSTKPGLGVSTSVKMPKPKSMADGFGKPSLFFKSEEIKSSSVKKLHDFLERKNKSK